jgi:hypothetical protein
LARSPLRLIAFKPTQMAIPLKMERFPENSWSLQVKRAGWRKPEGTF